MSCPSGLGTLNDTGITTIPAGTPDGQQDANFGRDSITATNSDSDGYKGFSFIKLDNNCTALANQSLTYTQQPWSFVKDNVTGLIWEIKADPFERPWFNNNTATNGGGEGLDNNGSNTQAYAAAATWCGKTDWRLPTIKELIGLVNSSKTEFAIDQNYFPNINQNNKNSDPALLYNAFFWSSTPLASDPTMAWAVNFRVGYNVKYYRKLDFKSVMLVRQAN